MLRARNKELLWKNIKDNLYQDNVIDSDCLSNKSKKKYKLVLRYKKKEK